MIGLSELSHTAHRLEEAVDAIFRGDLPLNEDNGRLLSGTIQEMESFLDNAAQGPLAAHTLPGKTQPLTAYPVPLGGEGGDLDGEDDSALTPPAWAFDLPEPDGLDLTPDFDPGAAPPETVAETGPQEVPPELLEVFALEAEEHLRTLSTLVPALERDPANKEGLLEIRRSAHTLKGCAAMVGFHSLTRLAHRMEDLFDLLYEDKRVVTPDIVQLLLASTDALEDMAAGKAQEQVVQALYGRYATLLGPGPATAESAPADQEMMPELPADPDVNSPRPVPAIPDKKGRYVRIPIERLDELVKLVSELVITRSSIEQRMTDFGRQLAELQLSSDRLGRISHKLETEYEAAALGGGGRAASIAPGPGQDRRLPPRIATHGFDDLEFDRYTEFHLQSRALAEATGDVQTVAGDLGHVIGDFDGYLGRQAGLCGEIEDKLMRLRMVPLSSLASRLSRAVRNVAEQQGKQVELVLEGTGTELDKTVLEAMADPLLHILRNAVDHGIEAPPVRQARGKPVQGTIRLRAFQEGRHVVLQISDDGAGLDTDRISTVARTRGLLSDAAPLAAEDLAALIFLPGFSTTAAVSEVSGRGVGLDIVKAQVHQLKGSLTVTSEAGRGAVFTVRLPLTLAITRALLVKAHQETFAIPLDGIRQILRLEKGQLESIGREPVVRIDGRVYPVVFLGKLLNLRHAADDAVKRWPVIILDVGARQVALVVDHLLGGREIVIKNLGSHLRYVKGVAGATLMGDGSVVLILNPPDLISEGVQPRPQSRPMPAPSFGERDALTVLVVDDSPSIRRVVSTTIKKAGWRPVAAKDGLEALEILHQSASLPDLLLLDVEMPRMDGYELLSTLKAQETYSHIPVVMVTSRAGEKHRRKALDLGASGYVIKPYQEQALLNTIRQLVRESRQAALT
jgi:chemosensory pili system protein ChpA (sensor histidine kinase/response regulator)